MKRVSLALLALAAAAPLRGQSLLDRGPNMGGSWVPDPAVVQFNFLHRFYVAPGPSHAVSNYPSFTLAAGIAHGIAFGGRFATKSLAGTGAGAQSTNRSEEGRVGKECEGQGRPGPHKETERGDRMAIGGHQRADIRATGVERLA